MILLKSKLYIPPLKPGIVICQRLVKKFQHGVEGKLTLISASAGFGKTTLVSQWIEQQKVAVAWYSLDQDDNEPSVFYRYLLTALQTLDSSLKVAFDPLFQGQEIVAGKDILVQIVNQLSNLSEKAHLVLDDYHMIQSKSIHDDMFYLLQNATPQLHITIITRHDPPFQLARLRARQEMIEIRASDLKFKETETAQFFREFMKLELSNEQIHELYNKTEGWIIGLQIIGLSLQKKENLNRLSTLFSVQDQNKYVLDYLFEEVMDNQPEEVQDFLLKTSILKQLHIDLCQATAGVQYGFDMLEKLERSNMFITPLDNKREWYQYHSLFSEMLRLRLKYCSKEVITDLHKNASRWYTEKGYLDEAFQHGFNSGDLDFTTELMENKLMSLLAGYEWAVARRWLNKLPDELIRQKFLLRLYNALFIFLQEELKDMDTMIANLENDLDEQTKGYTEERRKYTKDLLLSLKVNYLYFKDSVHVIPTAQEALKSISSQNTIALWLVQSVLSTAYILRGDIQPASELVQSALSAFKHSEPKENMYVIIHMLSKQADLEFLHGKLRNAEKMLIDALEYSRQEGFSFKPALAGINIVLSKIYFSQNHLKKSLKHATECVKFTKPVSDIGILLLGYKMEAFINQIFGHSNLASEIMHEAVLIASQTKSAVRIAYIKLAAVQLALIQSDLETVSKWAFKRNLCADEPFSLIFEGECLLMAHFHLNSQRYEEAVKLLKTLRVRAEKRNRQYSVLNIDVALAGGLYAIGEEDVALALLEKCIEYGAQEGYVRLFMENNAYLSKMLFTLRKSKNGLVRIYVPKLLKAIEFERNEDSIVQLNMINNVETLTPREVEILRLIAIGLTNKEIGEHTYVSLNTVKTHIRNIYGKLGVNNRETAILKAKDFNLF